MQQPRRTSEFVEDNQTNKRQSRPQRTIADPSPAPGTAKKYSARQSRIAVPTRDRASSLDRANSATNALLIALPGSATRGRSNSVVAPTPQRTALFKSPGRSLTAEKCRSRVTLLNDKRWIQDQVQRITEFLRKEELRALSSIPDFFNVRHGGLRQMSIKHFVTIVNYFLQYACGNRFTVTITNHVADIINVLTKLEYPYQLNKSWLKTPNTQHSFGNVLLLLDFFMDFALPRDEDEEVAVKYRFPLALPTEYTATRLEDEYQRIPDIEFHALMLRHAEEGFSLWDKQLENEFQALKVSTCDALIQKHCDFGCLAALESSIKGLEEQLAELEKQRQPLCKRDEEQHSNLMKKLSSFEVKIEKLSESIRANESVIKQMMADRVIAKKEISNSQEQLNALKVSIANQLCSIEERNSLINQVMEQRRHLQTKQQILADLQDFSYEKEVQLSRSRNQLSEQIQKFNAYVRQIAYSQLDNNYSADDLQLPLVINSEDLKRVLPILTDLVKASEAKLKSNSDALNQLKQNCAQIVYEIDYSLNPLLNSLPRKLDAAKEQLQKYEDFVAQEYRIMDENEARLNQRGEELKMQLEEYETTVKEQKLEVERMAAENEKIMTSTEEEYYKHAKEREKKLDAYAAVMEQANAELKQLNEIVRRNDKAIEKMKNEK